MDLNLNSENNILYSYIGVPLGCSKPVGTREELCYLKFDVTQTDDDASCTSLADEDQESHHLCGVSFVGLTKYGLYKFEDNFGYSMRIYNDTYFSSLEFGAYVKLASNGGVDGRAKVLIHGSITNNTAGHRLWDGYTAQSIEVSFSLPKHFLRRSDIP